MPAAVCCLWRGRGYRFVDTGGVRMTEQHILFNKNLCVSSWDWAKFTCPEPPNNNSPQSPSQCASTHAAARPSPAKGIRWPRDQPQQQETAATTPRRTRSPAASRTRRQTQTPRARRACPPPRCAARGCSGTGCSASSPAGTDGGSTSRGRSRRWGGGKPR